jgi:hypothetical protein
MAVIGDYGNRLAIVARQHALNRAAPVRLEGDPLANPELEHVRVGADVLQQTKALDNPMVEVDQFGFRQPINVDHHEASPSALNGGQHLTAAGREAEAAERPGSVGYGGTLGGVLAGVRLLPAGFTHEPGRR